MIISPSNIFKGSNALLIKILKVWFFAINILIDFRKNTIYLSIYLSTYLFTLNLSAFFKYLPLYISTNLFIYLFMYLSIYWYIYQCIYLSIFVYIYSYLYLLCKEAFRWWYICMLAVAGKTAKPNWPNIFSIFWGNHRQKKSF